MTMRKGNDMDPLLREIRQQPDTFRAAADGLRRQTAALERVAALTHEGRLPVILTGMGSSLDACQAAASLVARAGRPALAINTAELAHFQLSALLPGSCVVAVSQSGRSAEIVLLGERLADVAGVHLVAVTNGVDNPLAGQADVVVDMCAGAEIGPATKTFTASLVVLSALADAITSHATAKEIVARAIAAADSASAQAAVMLHDADDTDDTGDIERRIEGGAHLVILGRGVARAAAEVGSLVLKEASRTPAESMDAAEFRHGPLELAGPELAAVVVSLEPATLHLDRRLLDDMAGRGSAVLAIGLADAQSPAPRVVVDPVSPLFDVAVASVPLQLLAWRRARRSAAPGTFLIGEKVTTQE